MTDIARVTNIFYEAKQYNFTNDSIVATVDEPLIFPLVKNASEYQIGLSKASIPLIECPMRKSNLPLKQYQVGLEQGTFTGTAFTRQIGATSNNYVWILDGLTITKYLYTTTSMTFQNSLDVSPHVNFIQSFILDDYLNIYISGSLNNPVIADTLFIIAPNGDLITSIGFHNIKSLYINGIQQLFILDESLDGGECSIYDNFNGEDNVQLVLKGIITQSFANTQLNQCVFVIADLNNIIIGHDSTTLTIYNSNLEALTDYTVENVHNLTCANLLNGENSMVVCDTDTLTDQLIGVSATVLYDVEQNSQISQGDVNHSVVNVLSNSVSDGITYIIGADTFLYSINNPLNISKTWQLVTNANPLSTISANKYGLYGIQAIPSTFLGFNLDFAAIPTNTWQTLSDSLLINGNTIGSMDWNVANDYLFATEATNLYRSNYPVYPINYAFLQSGIMQIYGARTNSGFVNNQLLTAQITQTNNNNSGIDYSYQTSAYYFIEGNPGSQVITKRDQTNYNFTLLSTFNPTQPAGNITAITMCGPYMCVLAGNENIYIYSIDTTTLIHQINHQNENITCLTSVDDTSIIAYGVASPSLSTQSYIVTYNCATGLPLCVNPLNQQSPQISNIQSITKNINDQTNGCASVFYSYTTQDQFGDTNGFIYKMTYNLNYVNIAGNSQISSSSIATYPQISCNPNLGHLVVVQNTNTLNRVIIFTQSNSYSLNEVISTTLTWYGSTASFIILPNLDKLIQFTQVTTNEPIEYLAISRSSPNKLYMVSSTDSTIYSGFISNNAITFEQEQPFDTQTYQGLTTRISASPITNSQVTALAIQTQTQLNQFTLANVNIKSVAKNELTAEFMVPNATSSSSLGVYDYKMTYKYSLSSPIVPTYIYTKNGEDIDAGPLDIYSYQVLINAINIAFEEAYTRLKNSNPNAPPTAPSISMNYQTGLCTLDYDVSYSQSGNGILLNRALWELIKFNPYTVSIVPTLNGLYKLGLPLNSTSYTQSTSTIWAFNLLDQIAFESNTLFIGNSFFGNNQSNRIIATIDIPTSDILENNNVLYYQPTFMRPYTLSSNCPIDRIQINILYSYRDFTVYPLRLSAGQSWRAQFDFIKKY